MASFALDMTREALSALVLGALQGVTEFLPVSSSAHLILAGHVLGFALSDHHATFFFAQLASTMALLVVYRKRLARLATGFLSEGCERRFLFSIVFALLPLCLLPSTASAWVDQHLTSVAAMAAALVIGGVLMLLFESWVKNRPSHFFPCSYDAVPLFSSLGVGVAQCFSIAPGVSRLGSTVLGGMFLGINRAAAVEFSFILSIFTSLFYSASRLYQTGPLLVAPGWQEGRLAMIGFLVSFVVSLIACRMIIGYVKRHTLRIFGWWRILLGCLVFALVARP